WIPAPHPPHELADPRRILAGVESPVRLPPLDLVGREQVETSPRLLVAGQYQSPCRGVAAAAIRFDRDRLDIEEQQDAAPRPVPPAGSNAGQNRLAARVGADQFALHTAQGEAPFLSRRRRCSRLILCRTRCLIR